MGADAAGVPPGWLVARGAPRSVDGSATSGGDAASAICASTHSEAVVRAVLSVPRGSAVELAAVAAVGCVVAALRAEMAPLAAPLMPDACGMEVGGFFGVRVGGQPVSS